MPRTTDLSLVFVVGKGGAGKTTISAALALAAARRGKRVLVAMCNAKERLSYLLEVDPIGSHNQAVLPNIDAVNMTPQTALEEYGMMVLKLETLYRTIFENRIVSAFLRGTPGLEAWSMLGKTFFHTTETDRAGQKRYDLVILDAPSTGHGLEMLRVPQVIVDVVPPGLLRREADKALALFRDPARCGVLLVTLPEDMPTSESIELHHALTHELHLPMSLVVVNGVLPQLFEDSQRSVFDELPAGLPAGSPLLPLAEAGHVRATRERVQQESIERLTRAVAVPHIELPYLFVPEFRREAVESLAHALE